METDHVGVGRHDDAVVRSFAGNREILRADATAERGDHRADLLAAQHLVEPRLLDVQDLALDRQDRLEAAVASLLADPPADSPSTMYRSLWAGSRLLAVGKPAARAVESALAPHKVARLPPPRGPEAASTAFEMIRLATAGVSSRYVELLVDDLLDDAFASVLPSFVFVWPSNCG